MLAVRLREKFPDIMITETHPKALLLAIESDTAGFAKKFKIPDGVWNNEHERDASIGTVCAREGFKSKRSWPLDLALERYDSEQDPSRYWIAPVHYFWPECF